MIHQHYFSVTWKSFSQAINRLGRDPSCKSQKRNARNICYQKKPRNGNVRRVMNKIPAALPAVFLVTWTLQFKLYEQQSCTVKQGKAFCSSHSQFPVYKFPICPVQTPTLQFLEIILPSCDTLERNKAISDPKTQRMGDSLPKRGALQGYLFPAARAVACTALMQCIYVARCADLRFRGTLIKCTIETEEPPYFLSLNYIFRLFSLGVTYYLCQYAHCCVQNGNIQNSVTSRTDQRIRQSK